MQEILESFLRAFERAIAAEMTAMREQLGPFEIEIEGGREVQGAEAGAPGRHAAVYRLLGSDEKLVAGSECTLRLPGSERLVTLAALGRDASGAPTVTLAADRPLHPTSERATLVIYPWFLYEKLRASLAEIADGDRHEVASGLRAFGRLPTRRTPSPRLAPQPALNASQRAAVDLCAESDLAFVWGPPGTGKTTTLATILQELLAQGQRVLLTSTTNAAVDQALVALSEDDGGREAIERGDVVRLGRPAGATHGAGLADVVARRTAGLRERLRVLRPLDERLRDRIAACDEWLQVLDDDEDAAQGDLFGAAPAPTLSPACTARVFRPDRAARIAHREPDDQRQLVGVRRERLVRARSAAKDRAGALSDRLAAIERSAVADARLVAATLTQTTLNRLLEAERFDAVVVEEAGMAVLPALFFCATLAKLRVVLVGDPRQLPPIVQSRDPNARRFMGRSIFEVTVPEPHASPIVALLDTQYRMHPAIGALVSHLYYEGALVNDASTHAREAIAARAPFPGQAVAVVDTSGRTTCANPPGSRSRYNEQSARICVDLVREALEAGIDGIAVITPYAEQSRRLRRLLRDAGLAGDRVECSTVHRFQGHERDLVLLDAVDAAPLRPGVLLASRDDDARKLVNVSLSRARGKLVLVADVGYFAARAPQSAIGQALQAALAQGLRVRPGD